MPCSLTSKGYPWTGEHLPYPDGRDGGFRGRGIMGEGWGKDEESRDFIYRVPTQVLQSLIKSYICLSICKALQSLIFGVFSPKRTYKVLFLKEVSDLEL